MRTIHYLSDIIEDTLKKNPDYNPTCSPMGQADANRAIAEVIIDPTKNKPALLRATEAAKNDPDDALRVGRDFIVADVKVLPGDYLRTSATTAMTKAKNHAYFEAIVWQFSDGSEWYQIPRPTWTAVRDGSKLKTKDTRDYIVVPSNCVGFYIWATKSGYDFTYEHKDDKTPSNVHQFSDMYLVKFNIAGKYDE